jgi:hypothetical protein
VLVQRLACPQGDDRVPSTRSWPLCTVRALRPYTAARVRSMRARAAFTSDVVSIGPPRNTSGVENGTAQRLDP